MIDLDVIAKADVTRTPFDFFAVGNVLTDDDLAAVREAFPNIEKPGVFPLSALEYGQAFSRLIDDIRSPELATVVGEKLGVELAGLPMMITVRGHAQAKDGRAHTDTKDKVATCLLYLNDKWDSSGGRLRMLFGPDEIDNHAAEIPPNGGTLAAFKVGKNSWHGHKPYVGQRRYVMFNWIRSKGALKRQIGRHKLSAKIKKLIPFFYRGK